MKYEWKCGLFLPWGSHHGKNWFDKFVFGDGEIVEWWIGPFWIVRMKK